MGLLGTFVTFSAPTHGHTCVLPRLNAKQSFSLNRGTLGACDNNVSFICSFKVKGVTFLKVFFTALSVEGAWNILQGLVVVADTIVAFKKLLDRQWVCRGWDTGQRRLVETDHMFSTDIVGPKACYSVALFYVPTSIIIFCNQLLSKSRFLSSHLMFF